MLGCGAEDAVDTGKEFSGSVHGLVDFHPTFQDGGDADGFGEVAPFFQVAVNFPVGIAVVDDEEV